MRSKVNFGHTIWPPKKTIKFCIDLKWPELLSKVNFRHPKWPIDLKWPEVIFEHPKIPYWSKMAMRSKVNFGHPKWPSAAILSKFSKKNKVPYRSKMARNVIKIEFQTSKMADGSHFVKKIKKNKVAYWSEMARNAIESEFRISKMSARGHFLKKIKKIIKFRIDLKWPEMWSTAVMLSKLNKATRSPEISREQVQKLTPQFVLYIYWI